MTMDAPEAPCLAILFASILKTPAAKIPRNFKALTARGRGHHTRLFLEDATAMPSWQGSTAICLAQ